MKHIQVFLGKVKPTVNLDQYYFKLRAPYIPRWLKLLLASMMMKNMMEKFASPPKNKAEKKKWDAGE